MYIKLTQKRLTITLWSIETIEAQSLILPNSSSKIQGPFKLTTDIEAEDHIVKTFITLSDTQNYVI